jgi:hypothetical protein
VNGKEKKLATDCSSALAIKSPRYANNYSDQQDVSTGYAHHAYTRSTYSWLLNPAGWRDFIINNSGDPACDPVPSTCSISAVDCASAYTGPALTISDDIVTFNSD